MDSIQGAQQAIIANNGQRRDGVGGGLEYILYNIKEVMPTQHYQVR